MQDNAKLMLTVVAAGVLLGAGLSKMSSPVMQFAPNADWRSRLQPQFSATPLQFVDSAPQDLRPVGWTQGLSMIEEVYAPQYAVPDEVGQALDEADAAAARLGAPAETVPAADDGAPIDAAEAAVTPIIAPPAALPAKVTFGLAPQPEGPFQ